MYICGEIERVAGGYIVTIRPPFGGMANENRVVCATWQQVLELLTRAADNGESPKPVTQ